MDLFDHIEDYIRYQVMHVKHAASLPPTGHIVSRMALAWLCEGTV